MPDYRLYSIIHNQVQFDVLKKLIQIRINGQSNNFEDLPPVAPPQTTIYNESTWQLPAAALGDGAIPDPKLIHNQLNIHGL